MYNKKLNYHRQTVQRICANGWPPKTPFLHVLVFRLQSF